MGVSGSIRNASLAGRLFPVAADADPNRSLGGYTNEIEGNGDGTARVIQTFEPWSLEGLTISMNDSNKDQEFLQKRDLTKKQKPKSDTEKIQGYWKLTENWFGGERSPSAGTQIWKFSKDTLEFGGVLDFLLP